jgi:predicted dienelactone hydrolase
MKATVELDILPGTYPNALLATQSEMSVAIIAPRGLALAGLGTLTVAASTTFDAGAPSVSPVSGVALRDVNGDGRVDAVASFSVAALREAGLLSLQTTRLSVRATAVDGTVLTGVDRLFDVGVPVVVLPSPTGKEAVGTIQVLLFDKSRPGPTNRGRQLLLRVWYPAKPTPAQPTTYFLDNREAERTAITNQLPTNIHDIVQGWSIRDAGSALVGSRPTLLMSTGLGVALTYYSAFAQELASHGYVVIGLAHPDGSGVVVYPDGSSSSYDPAMLDDTTRPGVLRGWATDIEFVSSWLMAGAHEGAQPDPARAVLALVDRSRVGAFGHSFGGAAAVWAASETSALRASANLDGRFWGDVVEHGPATPVLLMLADGHLGRDESIDQFTTHTVGHVYTAEVSGTLHNNFSDSGILVRALASLDPRVQPEAFQVGAIDPARAIAIAASYLRAFFDAAWTGQEAGLLRGPAADFPEVRLTSH